jgi:hypothetical protein
MLERYSKIRHVQAVGNNVSGSAGPDTMYVVDLYENNKLIETRELPGKSRYYAEDVSENWDTGIIKTTSTS